MGNKKINKLHPWKKKLKNSFEKKAKTDNLLGLRDLKHDLENQLVKISQKLEHLRTKVISSSPKTLLQQYKELCEEYPEDVGNSMIFIDRIVYQMFCEIACITIIDGKSEKIIEYKNKHKIKIHKVIMRILLLYSDEMFKNKIRYDLQLSDIEWIISQDVFSAIILKIIQNCTKYCMPESVLQITINANEIKFIMKSIKIEYSERLKIFENGYSGRNTNSLGLNSSGKGLYHAKELAKFHELDLIVIPGTENIRINGCVFANNEFQIKLKKS